MAILFKQFKLNFISLIPILLLFIISLNGNSVIDFRFFSVNIHYILIYFWVLRRPQLMGIGYIFLSGIITDVVLGLPIGTSSLTLLVIAGVAAYVRVVTVRISLVNDWLSFIPALLIANFVYFLRVGPGNEKRYGQDSEDAESRHFQSRPDRVRSFFDGTLLALHFGLYDALNVPGRYGFDELLVLVVQSP